MITKLINSFIARVGTTPTTADSRLAKLSDLNTIVDAINTDFGYENYDFALALNGGEITFNVAGANGGSVPVTANQPSCRPGTCAYQYSNGDWGCVSCKLINPDTYNSPGNYTITFITPPPYGYAVFMSPPTVKSSSFAIVKSSGSFTIEATSGGADSNAPLDGATLTIRIYTNVTV